MAHLRIIIILLFPVFCSCNSKSQESTTEVVETGVLVGASRINDYLPILENKKVGMIVNHTSLVNGEHVVDTLLTHDINIVKIFTPEHGFRGDADAGEKVDDFVDGKTGLPIISLYGSKKKPSEDDLSGIDILVFDLQDVGTRFYTYISTMHYMMESAAENDLAFLVLDRPNPNGKMIDGPVLDTAFQSFVGMHPIPVAHGLTVGELALMINGEGWLSDDLRTNLTVINMINWNHSTPYELPVKPSPNLPTMNSIHWYPSLCFFEGTQMSIGRGTYHPFEVIGYPDSTYGEFAFKPVSIDGMSKYPRHENEDCYGVDLRKVEPDKNQIDLTYLIEFHKKFKTSNSNPEESFFIKYFDTLAGTDSLRKQIEEGFTEGQIRASWESDLDSFKALRENYLLYSEGLTE